MTTLCIEKKITQPPCQDQMVAISERLENRCWRSIPTINQFDLMGIKGDGPDAVNARFDKLVSLTDNLFEYNTAKKIPLTSDDDDYDAIEMVLASLPKIFTKNEDFWPTKKFLKNLLYMNTLETFTETCSLMALVSSIPSSTQKFVL
jgi:hypothetical protein